MTLFVKKYSRNSPDIEEKYSVFRIDENNYTNRC